MNTSRKALTEFNKLGFETIRITPGETLFIKNDLSSPISTKSWETVTEDKGIGIFLGFNGVAVIDYKLEEGMDSYQEIVNWLSRLGVSLGQFTVVHSTANQRIQIFISLAKNLPGGFYPLSPEIGKGILKYGPGICEIAPPSKTTNGGYYLREWEFSNLPVIPVDQILNLLDLPILPSWKQEGFKPLTEDELYGIPARVMALIQGDGVESCVDCLELEQAIAISLIKRGYSDGQILSIFLNYPVAGKFKEIYVSNADTGLKWLRLLIESARVLLNSYDSIDHRIANLMLNWALSSPWPGRTGATDQAVMIAHLSIALRRGQLIYGASVREIAELAGITRTSASIATNRLIDDGHLRLVQPTVGSQANIYDLTVDMHNLTILIGTDCQVMHSHDAFRWSGLGKAAALVIQALSQEDSLTVAQLAEMTGKHRSTVRRALKKMASIHDPITGEEYPMVEEINQEGAANRWRALDVDLDHVAKILGTKGIGDKQKHQ
ncbi:helix-turn-helix domain-containing protein, partial [Chloroflexota bacterium]